MNNNFFDFPANNNNSISFGFKQQITRETASGDTKDVEIMVPLKYLINVWRTLEISLISYEISLRLKWSKDCILVADTAANQNPIFKIIDTKLYVPVVVLSTQDNIKLAKQLESGFKRTIAIDWNKYLSKTSSKERNSFLDFLIDATFQGLNRLFVLSFKNEGGPESHRQYYLPTSEIKDYNLVIDERNVFDQPMKKDLKAYDNTRKITKDLVMIKQLDGY